MSKKLGAYLPGIWPDLAVVCPRRGTLDCFDDSVEIYVDAIILRASEVEG